MPNVWVVEDNALFRATLRELLDASEVIDSASLFGTAEDALLQLERGSLPDAVLMDIGLPGMNGIDAVTAFRRRAPTLPIVMLTVHRDNERIFRAICAGACGYLLKSSTADRIVSAIQVAIGGGSPIDEFIARRVLDTFARIAPPPTDYNLTSREVEILQLLVEGLTQREIAERLFVSSHTIDGHVRHIYAKLEVHTRSGAVAKALRENLV